MSLFGILFLVITSAALFMVPRRWAPLPLLVGACYMTLGQQMLLGPFHFTVIRVLVFVGLVRVLMRSERIVGGLTLLDKALFVWAGWALISSFFHAPAGEALVFRLGLVYNTLGIFLLIRVFCQSLDDIIHIIKITAYLLAPVALEMVLEHLTTRNMFAVLGGVPEMVAERDERFRAQGPFSHPILAGTVGAACLPLMIGIWREARYSSRLGLVSCLLIIVASNSSGPLMSLILGLFAVILWRWRHLTRQMRIAAVVGYILLDFVMKSPAYFIMSRIDLTGSSGGWHRAELIRTSIEHLNEWWWAGTDYTRHWMPTGVTWSEDHTDITNHYIKMGVIGGLPLMLLFIWAIGLAFSYVGRSLRAAPERSQFIIWCLGAAMFAQATSMISVSYFDQSFMFLYLDVAIIVCAKVVSTGPSLAVERGRDSGRIGIVGAVEEPRPLV